MNNEAELSLGTAEETERLSQELERDARRYPRSFTEEDEVRLA